MPRREARVWAEAAGAGQPGPAWAGDCGAEPEPGGSCADMGGQVTRNLLYGKDRPLRRRGRRLGKGRRGMPGMRVLPDSSSRSIPLQERGWPGRKLGLGWGSSGCTTGVRGRYLPRQR